MLLNIYTGIQTAQALLPQPVPAPARSTWFGVGGIQPQVPMRQRVRGRAGMGDVNTDAMARLNSAGFKGASCKFVPFSGPFTGGTNVCDVDGDTSGFAYGAELINRSGGTDIMRTEIANMGRYAAERAAEQETILVAARAKQQAATAAQVTQNAYVAPVPTSYTGPQQPAVPTPIAASPTAQVMNSSAVPTAATQAGASNGISNTATTRTVTGATVGTSNGMPSFVTDALNKVDDMTGDMSLPVKLGIGVVLAFLLYKAGK